MSTKYKATTTDEAYFITITTVGWIDVFTRLNQKYVITNALKHCQEKKGLEIYAYCLMSSHLHLLCKGTDGFILSDIMRDFKKFTSKQIVKTIQEEPESRRVWMLEYFQKSCAYSFTEGSKAKLTISVSIFSCIGNTRNATISTRRCNTTSSPSLLPNTHAFMK